MTVDQIFAVPTSILYTSWPDVRRRTNGEAAQLLIGFQLQVPVDLSPESESYWASYFKYRKQRLCAIATERLRRRVLLPDVLRAVDPVLLPTNVFHYDYLGSTLS